MGGYVSMIDGHIDEAPMADREKLIALIGEIQDYGRDNSNISAVCKTSNETLADHLIANGVTIQRWIPVAERLPNEDDADEDFSVLAIHKATKRRSFHWRTVADNPFDFTHWMPMPQPPKGE